MARAAAQRWSAAAEARLESLRATVAARRQAARKAAALGSARQRKTTGPLRVVAGPTERHPLAGAVAALGRAVREAGRQPWPEDSMEETTHGTGA